MRYIKKEFQTKRVEVVVESKLLCDKCNEAITGEGNFDAFKFKIQHKTGGAYPSGGSGEEESVDLCQDCAAECIELLKLNGYRINREEWDY